MKSALATSLLVLSAVASPLLQTPALAGPYPGMAGTEGSDAVAMNDAAIVAWATGAAELVRGPINLSNLAQGYAFFGTAANALGPVLSANPADVFDTVSLGDGGSITLTFAQPIRDGEGWDFAVFENGFSYAGESLAFLELAFVEVSSNGVDFFRFPAVSLTPTDTQVGTFEWIDPTDLYNLAGKHLQGWGTPFDLAALATAATADPRLDLATITHVRLVDVVGSIQPTYARLDSLGNVINGPWPTPFNTGGFDLDAVAVRHVAAPPAPTGYAAWKTENFTAEQLAVPAFIADDADPDGDGRANLLEYALGTTPTTADADLNAPALSLTDGHLRLTYVRPDGRDDLAYAVDWSSDLATWYSSTEYVITDAPIAAEGGGALITARAVAPFGVPARQFLRLHVSPP
ncbi:MAG: hypothetical protein H7067_11695 [Burkholderiales bacterium]|nr:hypothetical protein [Opitutaceae bacterium]